MADARHCRLRVCDEELLQSLLQLGPDDDTAAAKEAEEAAGIGHLLGQRPEQRRQPLREVAGREQPERRHEHERLAGDAPQHARARHELSSSRWPTGGMPCARGCPWSTWPL